MALGKTVTVRSYADRMVIVHNDTLVGVHPRHFGRDKVIYDPWLRIPMMSAAYSDASRPAVPIDVGRVFRLKSATP